MVLLGEHSTEVLVFHSYEHRYGVAGVLTEDLLWLLGGIQLYMTPGLLVVNLLHRTWMEYRLKVY